MSTSQKTAGFTAPDLSALSPIHEWTSSYGKALDFKMEAGTYIEFKGWPAFLKDESTGVVYKKTGWNSDSLLVSYHEAPKDAGRFKPTSRKTAFSPLSKLSKALLGVSSEDIYEEIVALVVTILNETSGGKFSKTPREVDEEVRRLLHLKGASANVQYKGRLHLIPKHLELETSEEQHERGHYHPGLVLIHDGVRFPLNAGQGDSVTVFSDGSDLFILSENHRLPYIGLEIYPIGGDPKAEEWDTVPKHIGDCFFQEGTIAETLGPNWEDLAPAQLVEALAPYCGAG